MCDNCINEQLQAERDELKLQVEALTEAQETQKRENQPYIKELKHEADTYRRVIEQILLEMEYGTSHDNIPPALFTNVARTLSDNDICIISNPVIRAIGIYRNKETAAGGVNPESK
jgi:2-succinyl-5-enolpyruvyl-6-hydroxy-3-cyclohexene-1-carboxylate synthase